MIQAHIYDELSWGQAEFSRILSHNGQNDLEGQCQWPLFSIPAESIPWCKFGAHLEILAQIYDELSRGQAKILRVLSQNGQNDIEGQGQWPLFPIPTKNISWCMFGANLVILAQICDELSCGKAKFTDRRTDVPTDGQTKKRRKQYPFNLKGQWVKRQGLHECIFKSETQNSEDEMIFGVLLRAWRKYQCSYTNHFILYLLRWFRERFLLQPCP